MKLIKLFIILVVPMLLSTATKEKDVVSKDGIKYLGPVLKLSGAEAEVPPEDSQFGFSTSIDCDFAAVSAPFETIDSLKTGAVYLYRKYNNDWLFSQKIMPNTKQSNQGFGAGVLIKNNTLFISTPGANKRSGLIDIYALNGQQWEFKQTLKPETPILFGHFGNSIRMEDNILMISSMMAVEFGPSSGSIFIFEKNNELWEQKQKINSPVVGANDLFGANSTIVSENHILISAPRGDATIEEVGVVYSYKKTDNTWEKEQVIMPLNPVHNGLFGGAIDYSAGNLVIGSMQAKVDSVYCGEVNMYHLNSINKWEQTTRFIPEELNHHDYYGASVLIDQNFLLIGSPKWDKGMDDLDHGTVYVFQKNNEDWEYLSQIIPDDLEKNDHFGMAMSISGDDLVIGSSLNDNPHSNNGASYFYSLDELTTSTSEEIISSAFSIEQNFPNPFNSTTVINYFIPVETSVIITVFNQKGQTIAELIHQKQLAGNHQVLWNGIDSSGEPVSPGNYIYKMETPEFNRSKQMILMK